MRYVLIPFIALALAACGSSGGGSAPTTPTPTVTGLTISGTAVIDLMKLRATDRWTATATLSTGTTQAVTATWSTDNSAVATVDTTGTVTAVGPGQVNVIADYQGQRAVKLVRVVPDYGGHWTGQFASTGCQVTGDFQSDWCGRVSGVAPVTFDLIQTRDIVSGNWTLLDLSGVFDGGIAQPGTLSLTGAVYQGPAKIDVTNWQSISTDNRTMTGHFSLVWTVPGLAGSARVDVEIRNCTKS